MYGLIYLKAFIWTCVKVLKSKNMVNILCMHSTIILSVVSIAAVRKELKNYKNGVYNPFNTSELRPGKNESYRKKRELGMLLYSNQTRNFVIQVMGFERQ